ncbi:phage integrase family protein [Psychromonas ingrahamii 37]|uniref:Phage integrase family protein n=1 Tax=Psychromonas ingrahamii (strain DSM 17664 / CCUG 51855 / 37) TaxID=357804 RepID=A1SRI6_PSYIN|nr:integrase arm-type DNA-binding domain-containing protein [Psychromonas ingrahamii]ABM02101.1 phage integrase family protein [Psychromonas ingrahamii 37]
MAKTTPLSDTQIRLTKASDKVITLSDGGGLQLRIKPNGSKLWQLRFNKPIEKKPALMGFGAYPAISLANARKLREAANELLAQGINPKAQRDSEIKEKELILNNTFEMVTAAWIKLKASEVKPDSLKTISTTLTNHILPRIGKCPITEITAPMAIEALRPIEAKGNHEVIARACQYLNQIMRYATNLGMIHSNPLTGIKGVFMTKKITNNPHVKPEELPQLLMAIATANIKKITRNLILWQLHTMTRPAETALAQWNEIDYENNLWIIPGERIKTGMTHQIPLTVQTLAILEACKVISGNSDYIFPADRNPNAHANKASANMAFKRMGYQGRQTAHGLRGLARTTLSDKGVAYEPSEACLSHKVGNSVSQSYNHSTYLNQRIKIMAWWSNYIEEASYGNISMAGSKGVKVVGTDQT